MFPFPPQSSQSPPLLSHGDITSCNDMYQLSQQRPSTSFLYPTIGSIQLDLNDPTYCIQICPTSPPNAPLQKRYPVTDILSSGNTPDELADAVLAHKVALVKENAPGVIQECKINPSISDIQRHYLNASNIVTVQSGVSLLLTAAVETRMTQLQLHPNSDNFVQISENHEVSRPTRAVDPHILMQTRPNASSDWGKSQRVTNNITRYGKFTSKLNEEGKEYIILEPSGKSATTRFLCDSTVLKDKFKKDSSSIQSAIDRNLNGFITMKDGEITNLGGFRERPSRSNSRNT